MIVNTLFDKIDLREKLKEVQEKALDETRNIEWSIVENNDDEVIVEYYFSKNYIMPIDLKKESMTYTSRTEIKYETKSDYGQSYKVPHRLLVITIKIPFTGSAFLWDCRPSSYPVVKLHGWLSNINNDRTSGNLNYEFCIEPQDGSDNNGVIEKEISDFLNLISAFLTPINEMVNTFNARLKTEIEKTFQKQKNHLSLVKTTLKGINIPLERNPNAPELIRVPINRAASPVLNTKTSKPAKTEYEISDEDYMNILKIIKHEGRTHEQNSCTFIKLKEEEIRNFYLAHFNGHYNGMATGETFRKMGKTDIRIEFENRSAFVAECKIWRGEKELHDAIDQLASYTTWRDCKCSLIIYNKTVKGFTTLVKEMPNRLNTYKNVVGKTETKEPGEWRLTIKSNDDENRHIIIHVFMFNLYNHE
ncbi:MAG TPA: hypothetical protein PLF50_01420 [Candidatus Cloacimonadota bacterium]|mgnify:CR=1 FL=1|nr:hypothetical protein [Candidatus Cloacimonadota bacterium]